MGKSTISMVMFYVANCKRLPGRSNIKKIRGTSMVSWWNSWNIIYQKTQELTKVVLVDDHNTSISYTYKYN